MVQLIEYKIFIFFLLFSMSSVGAEIDNSVKQLEKITKCKMVITSGYRTPKKNKEVGGVPNSYHLKNRARDLVPKNKKCISFKKLAKTACKLKLNVIEYKNHVHIDNRKNPKCWKVKK